MYANPQQAAQDVQRFPFDGEYQKGLFRLLCEDGHFAHTVEEYLEPQFFESEALNWGWSFCKWFKGQYGALPALQTIQQQANILDVRVRPLYQAVFEQVGQAPLRDETWMRDKVLDFIRRNIFVRSFHESRTLYNNGKIDDAYDLMSNRMEKILTTTWAAEDDSWFFENLPVRQIDRQMGDSSGESIATGFDFIDNLLSGGLSLGELGIWIAYAKHGKALRDDQRVLTPTGWFPISQLKKGDSVVGGSTGKPQCVTGVFPQGVRSLYRIDMKDGASVIASGDHLWKVQTRRTVQRRRDPTWEVVTTLQLLNLLKEGWVWLSDVPPVEGRRRTKNRYRHVAKVTPVKKGSCTCITVDDPEQLFVTEGHIVTHNSTMLLNHGVSAIKLQFRQVAHFVFEGSRKQTEDRYEACFAEECYHTLRQEGFTSERYRQVFQEYQMYTRKLYIKGFTDKWSYSVVDVHEKLKDLKRSHGWKPDLVVIDYGDLLTGREKKYSNETEKQKAAFRDLKSLANRGYAVWTASQARRPEKGSEDKAHWLYSREIADCYDKVRVADFLGSLNSTNNEKANHVMRILLELYRDNSANIMRVVRADVDKMKIKVDPNIRSPDLVDVMPVESFGLGKLRNKSQGPQAQPPQYQPQQMTAALR